MTYYKFESNDILKSFVNTKPLTTFKIYNQKVYYNETPREDGQFSSTKGVLMMDDDGHASVSLYELNVDRENNNLIEIRSESLENRLSDSPWSNSVSLIPGTTTESLELPLSSSFDRTYYKSSEDNFKQLRSLKNTINHYSKNNFNFNFDNIVSSGLVNCISIPSIHYGTKIEPGSIDLKFFVDGELYARLQDTSRNGELRQTYNKDNSSQIGNVEGIVLYREGFFILNGSDDVTNTVIDIYDDLPSTQARFKWRYFAGLGPATRSSYLMSFRGNVKIPTITMLTRAPSNELNFSNNLTFLEKDSIVDQQAEIQTTRKFVSKKGQIKNITKSKFSDMEPDFEKQVYISKIVIYDENKNVLGIAKLSTPVRKREYEDLLFKIKTDL